MGNQYINKFNFPAMLGASIEYYDIALYGYMAPVLVQVFLPHVEKTTAYFVYFLFDFVAAIFQVMGAKFYGSMGDAYGRKQALYLAMLGTSCATFLISILPTYQHIGILAAILFAGARAMQSFFLGGEYNGGAIYCLEHEDKNSKHGAISGIYCALTVTGIIMASLVATMVNAFGPQYFRIAYAISFILALCTYRIRRRIKETPKYLATKTSTISAGHANVGRQFIAVIVASLFFGMLYGLSTRIFNVILPMAIDVDRSQLMQINTLFLVFYLALLIIFGFMADRYGSKKIMLAASIATAIVTYPLMLLIETKLLLALIFAKGIFAILCAGFMAPFHAWAQNLFPTKLRYLNISMCYAIGKCFSTIFLAGSILLFERQKNLQSVGVILIFASLITVKIFYGNSGWRLNGGITPQTT